MAYDANAHGVMVYGYEQSGEMVIEGYYLNNAPCRGCAVIVQNSKTGQEILSGSTNDEGILIIQSQPEPVLLFIKDGTGHAARYLMEPGSSEVMREQRATGAPLYLKAAAGLLIIGAVTALYIFVRGRKGR